jgi:predicted Rossmann-fold nucleotide-binding protein
MDELMEVLTLVQTQKLARKLPIILYGSSYWNEIINFEALIRHGVISRADLRLFAFADDPGSALKLLQEAIEVGHEEKTPAFAASRCGETL